MPTRVIEGQGTLQGRTNHEIGVDSIHDEIVVPNPFAEAILFFRGGANGEEPPIRFIQGPKTLLGYTDNVAVDPIHNEVFTAQFRTDAILVFRRDAQGDVAPIRIIHGPKTKLDRPWKLSVDPINNLLAIGTSPGIWIFNRTDNGDVAPKWTIAGPKTMLEGNNLRLSTPVLYPEGKKIFLAGGNGDGIIGVWKYGDNGDIPPWAVLRRSPITTIKNVPKMALNPDAKELILPSGGRILFFHVPEVFE